MSKLNTRVTAILWKALKNMQTLMFPFKPGLVVCKNDLVLMLMYNEDKNSFLL